MSAQGGACSVHGGCLPGRCLPGGGLPGGCLPMGASAQKGVCAGGVCAGGSAWGYLPRGCVCPGVSATPPNRITDACENITLPQLRRGR